MEKKHRLNVTYSEGDEDIKTPIESDIKFVIALQFVDNLIQWTSLCRASNIVVDPNDFPDGFDFENFKSGLIKKYDNIEIVGKKIIISF